MTTLAEIEVAVEGLPRPDQEALLQHLACMLKKRVVPHRHLPVVPATGRPITQHDIDDALDAD